jgi:Trypsin-co-occurring domain 2
VLELAKVIRDLRAELEIAIAAADGETLLFELGPIELDVSVAIEAGAQAGAKARFWVVELGTQANVDHTATQHIKLTLSPKLGPAGDAPYVSGTVGRRER